MGSPAVPRARRLTIEGTWILIGQVLSIAGALGLVRILTQYLQPAQYGVLALSLTITGLVNQVVMGGVSATVGRHFSVALETGYLQGYLREAMRILGVAALAMALTALLAMATLAWLGLWQWVPLAGALCLLAITNGLNATLSSIQGAARERALVAFHVGLDAGIKLLVTLLMLRWLRASATSVITGYAISSAVVTGSQFYFLRKTLWVKSQVITQSASFANKMWGYGLPFASWGVFTWMQQASDRWALEAYATTNDVGLYSVLFQIGYAPISMATGLAVTFLAPIMYQRSGGATDVVRNGIVHRLSWRMTIASLLLTLVGVAVAFVTREWVFRLLVGELYREGARMLPWVVLAGGLFAAGQVLALKLMTDMQTSRMIGAKIATSVGGACINILGARLFGVSGVIGGLVAFSAAYLCWMMFLARSNSQKP